MLYLQDQHATLARIEQALASHFAKAQKEDLLFFSTIAAMATNSTPAALVLLVTMPVTRGSMVGTPPPFPPPLSSISLGSAHSWRRCCSGGLTGGR